MGVEIPAPRSTPAESLVPARIRNQNLPPVEYAPILREYGRLGLHRFQEIYGMPTFTDDRGFVDYGKTLDYINQFVKPDYRWRLEPEAHHLLHEAKLYKPENFDANELDDDGDLVDPDLPGRVRENPFDKIVIPGDLHDLWHVLLIPPNRPDYMHLKQREQRTSIAISLFRHAKIALEIEQREGNFVTINHPDFSDKLIDLKERRIINRDVLVDQYVKFAEKFRIHLTEIDLKEIESLIDLNVLESIDPAKAIVLDMGRKMNLSGSKRGIKPILRHRSQKAA